VTSRSRTGVSLLVASASTGALVATLPGIAIQAGLVAGAAMSTLSLALARAGRVLDPAWVIVGAIYMIDPISAVMQSVDVTFPPPLVPVALGAPFVATALVLDRRARAALVALTPLLILFGLAGLSLLWTPDASEGARKLSVFLFTGILPAAYALALVVARGSIDWRIAGIAAVMAALALLAIGEITSAYPGRLVVFGGNPIWIARAAFLGALVFLWGPFHPIVKVVVIPMLLYAGLETLSLGPAVGFLAGSLAGLVVALMGKDLRDRRVQAGWTLLFLAIGVVAMLLLAGAGSSLLEGAVEDSDTASRAGLISMALGLFADSPLFGAGIGAFAFLDPIGYPHNLPVEIAAEMGLAGLAGFLVWLFMALIGARRSPILMSTLVGTVAFAMFSGSLASNTEFWVISALAIGAWLLRSARSSDGRAPRRGLT
jgi:hypothetical protein